MADILRLHWVHLATSHSSLKNKKTGQHHTPGKTIYPEDAKLSLEI